MTFKIFRKGACISFIMLKYEYACILTTFSKNSPTAVTAIYFQVYMQEKQNLQNGSREGGVKKKVGVKLVPKYAYLFSYPLYIHFVLFKRRRNAFVYLRAASLELWFRKIGIVGRQQIEGTQCVGAQIHLNDILPFWMENAWTQPTCERCL